MRETETSQVAGTENETLRGDFMEIKEMQMSDIEARKAEIRSEMTEATLERLTELNAEADELEARKAELQAEIEERAAVVEQVVEETADVVETRSLADNEKIVEEVKTMSNLEVRKSNDYAIAFIRGCKDNNFTECRALLTDAVEGGSIPVPVTLETEIKNAWESNELLKLAKHSEFKGDVKVSFEYAATGAVLHVEGSAAPEEENLSIGTVEIHNDFLKKWITVSDSAMDNVTVATTDYIFREIAQRIAEAGEAQLIAKIVASPAVSNENAAGVPVYTANTVAVDTITMALAELSANAKNIVLAMNRRTRAAFIAAAKNGKYALDPFDGCTVVLTDNLPAFGTASTGNTYVIAGDFNYGTQVNMPMGDGAKIIVDEFSMAEKDLVKIVGKQLFGCGVVAPNALVKINK